MAQSHQIQIETQPDEPTATAPDAATSTEFGAEFRELARQRRFVRSSDPAAASTASWRDAVATPPVAAPATAPAAPAPEARTAPPAPAAPTVRTPARSQRLSEDQRAMIAELARMSDRLVQSREALAVAVERVQRLEQELSHSNDRMMAARMLVREAQRETRACAERAEYLEGRCEMLQEALELAVNASFLTRWRWRREQRQAARIEL